MMGFEFSNGFPEVWVLLMGYQPGELLNDLFVISFLFERLFVPNVIG